MAQTLVINMTRPGPQPWGFRLQGGLDFASPLTVLKVNEGSLAEASGLRGGDTILRVNNTDVLRLRHQEALDAVASAGNHFQLLVSRPGIWKPDVTPLDQPMQTANGETLLTKTSLALRHEESKRIGSGHNSKAAPFGMKQPYNEKSIKETLSSQSEVLAQGVVGVNFKKNEKTFDSTKSDVFKMLQEIDKEPPEEEVPVGEGSSETHRSVIYESSSSSSSKTVKETTTTSGTFVPPVLRPVAQPPRDMVAQQDPQEPTNPVPAFVPPVLRPVAQPPRDMMVQQEPQSAVNSAPAFVPPVLRPVAQPPRDIMVQQEPQPAVNFTPAFVPPVLRPVAQPPRDMMIQQEPQQQPPMSTFAAPQSSSTFAPRPAPSPISGVRSVAPPVANKTFKGPEPPTATADSPRCGECDRLIVGVFVRIKEKNLHVECFKCATCGTSLKNVGYFKVNDKLYCDVHAKMVAQHAPPAPDLRPITIKPGAPVPKNAMTTPEAARQLGANLTAMSLTSHGPPPPGGVRIFPPPPRH